eukprot:jgi/Bigna1/78868/fgenesh1_pg.57_\
MNSILKDVDRTSLFPIRHKDIWNAYKIQQAGYWTAEEIDFSNDADDFSKLSQDEQKYLKYTLIFFANSDIEVNEMINRNLYEEFKALEIRMCYDFQRQMENIHTETYNLQIDTLIKDKKEKEDLINAVKNNPIIEQKINFCRKQVLLYNSIQHKLICQVIFEGIFFASSFACIYYFKQKGILKGLTLSNEFISRDENLHYSFSIMLYNKLEKRLSQAEVAVLFDKALCIERDFITQALPVRLLGMNADMMLDYIKFTIDNILLKLGYDTIHNVSNPLTWMERLDLQGKTNFFESRESNYQSANVLNENKEDIFQVDLNF